MVDEADISAETEELARRTSLDALLKRRGANTASLEFCESCGEPIPEARRQAVAGCRLCIECARKNERVQDRLFPRQPD